MQEAIRLRELEAECRQRALSEPDKKWYWLAQAAKYQVQANQKLAFRSEEANAPDSPEIKLAQWSHVRDERRVMEPFPTDVDRPGSRASRVDDLAPSTLKPKNR
jgi:hypothetical protein